jgi:hypothetical protein
MKRYILITVFALTAFIGQIRAQELSNESVLNQQSDTVFDVPYAQPVKIDFNIPIKMHSWSYDSKYGNSEGGTGSGAMEKLQIIGNSDALTQRYAVNGIVTLLNYNGGTFISFRRQTIRFLLDTTNFKLRDVHISIEESEDKGDFQCERDSFDILEIPYTISWNHHLYASIEGATLFSNISNIYYFKSETEHWGNNYTHYYNEYIGISTDIGGSNLSIDISPTDPRFGANLQKNLNSEFLSINENGLSDLLTFTFSSANQSRDIKIYDLIGREKYRNEVTPSTTSLYLSKNILPPGCYIASLGNSRAKFILAR